MDPKVLAFQFGIGDFVLTPNLAGVTHEESLQVQRPAGNTMNWIVGHRARARDQALGLLGVAPLYEDADFPLYGAGTFLPERALELAELIRRFKARAPELAGSSQERLAAAAAFSPSQNPAETGGALLASIAFHEDHELGQTGLSRRLLGKRGALLAPGEEGH